MDTLLNIRAAIEKDKDFPFRPSPQFYQATGINRKRWGLIYIGKIEPTISEVDKLSKYFGIPVTNFF